MSFDPWMNLNGTGEEHIGNGQAPYLDVADHYLSDRHEDWISPELKQILSAETRTYLLVDATQRKKITQIFDLDDLELECRCLFKGEAAENWKASAPYLIDMTLPADAWEDASKVSHFHRSFIVEHWGQDTGIIVQTTASMDAVWRHFRRFTRVQVDGQESWLLFRFWDPRVARGYFSGIRSWEERVRQFFLIQSEAKTLSMIIESEGGTGCTEIRPSQTFLASHNTPAAPFRLTQDDINLLEGQVREKFIRDVAMQSAEFWPEKRRIFETEKAWHDEIDRLIRQAHDAGLHLDRDIRDFISITIDKGRPFWAREDVRDILSRPHLNTPTLRMLALRNKLETGAIR